jgi:uncharacterized membrane protein YphA (DoxX/SURF4 family)
MKLLKNPWLTWICSLVLGCTFVYSSYHKILDPPDFAKAIHNYYVVPGELVNLAAIYMPWFELIGGLAIAVGVARRGAALGFGLLALVFIAALSYNLLRGHPTVCGCFGTFAEGEGLDDQTKFFLMWREIFIDIGLVLLSAQVLYATASAPKKPKPALA